MSKEDPIIESDITFGKSIFKGKNDLHTNFHRWCIQFYSLVKKNVLILSRRRITLTIFLLLQCATVPILLLGNKPVKVSSLGYQVSNRNPEPISSLGNSGSTSSKSARIAFSPLDVQNKAVMNSVAKKLDLKMGIEVRGFKDRLALKVWILIHFLVKCLLM